MKRDDVNYVLVGGFVLVMGVLLLVALLAVTGRHGPTDTYYVMFDNVAGLKYGTGVFYEGYRVGQVEAVTPTPTADGMRYRLELAVARGWRIPDDSVATVASAGLIAAVTVEISEGRATTALAPGATLRGEARSDLFSVLNQAAGDFRVLSRDGLMPVLRNLDQRIGAVSDELLAFRHDQLVPLVSMIHQRLDRDVLGEMGSVLKHLDESALALKAVLGDENQAHVRDILGHADEVTANLNDVVLRLEDTRARADRLLVALDGLASDNRDKVGDTVTAARNSMRELDQALSTLNARLAQILTNLEGGSRHMNEFARSIRDNPARVLRSSGGAEPGQR